MTTGNLSKSTEATILSELVLNPRLVKRGRTNDIFILNECKKVTYTKSNTMERGGKESETESEMQLTSPNLTAESDVATEMAPLEAMETE